VYINNLGHNETSWADQRYLKSITEAVRWIRGDIQLDAKPNPDLSAQQEQTAKAAAEAVGKSN
jgi:type 1 glutamine amidotransferase